MDWRDQFEALNRKIIQISNNEEVHYRLLQDQIKIFDQNNNMEVRDPVRNEEIRPRNEEIRPRSPYDHRAAQQITPPRVARSDVRWESQILPFKTGQNIDIFLERFEESIPQDANEIDIIRKLGTLMEDEYAFAIYHSSKKEEPDYEKIKERLLEMAMEDASSLDLYHRIQGQEESTYEYFKCLKILVMKAGYGGAADRKISELFALGLRDYRTKLAVNKLLLNGCSSQELLKTALTEEKAEQMAQKYSRKPQRDFVRSLNTNQPAKQNGEHQREQRPTENENNSIRNQRSPCRHCNGTSHPHWKCWYRPGIRENERKYDSYHYEPNQQSPAANTSYTSLPNPPTMTPFRENANNQSENLNH